MGQHGAAVHRWTLAFLTFITFDNILIILIYMKDEAEHAATSHVTVLVS